MEALAARGVNVESIMSSLANSGGQDMEALLAVIDLQRRARCERIYLPGCPVHTEPSRECQNLTDLWDERSVQSPYK